MWRRTVLVLHLLAIHNSSQLDSNGTEASVKCCPCPGEPGAGPALVEPEGARLCSAPLGPAAAGGCPCLARDADAEGAASMFFPQAVRAFGNGMRPDPKEDAKPLLHPEVDLASSVLETLREVTDEEYREALERDAARAAADEVQFRADDDAPEDSRNVVTIIVSPQDMDVTHDIFPEASHVQETRCIHPSLGNARDSYRSPNHQNGLEEILNLPLPGGLLHRQRDSYSAASDVHESIVKPESNLNRLLSGLKLRSNPSLFKLNKNKITHVNQEKNIENEGRTPINSIVATSLVTDPETREHSTDVDRTSDLAVLNTDCERQSVSSEEALETNQPVLDSDSSPNNFNEEFIKTSEQEDNARQNEVSLPNSKYPQLSQNIIEPSQKPFPLKNLFKLRDVELIPLDINNIIPKSKLNIPNLKFETFQNEKARTHPFDPVKIPTLTDLFGKPSKISKENVDVEDIENHNPVDKENSGNIQAVVKRKEITTEILDTVPSPSEVNNVVTANKECLSLESHSDKSSNGEFEEAGNLLDNDTNEVNVLDAETITHSIPDDENPTHITDLESVENVESKANEQDQTNDPNISENLGENGDSDILVFSSEEVNDVPPSAIDLSAVNKPEERSQEVINDPHPLKNLEEIRRSVVEKLDALQINNRNALNNIRHSMEEISERAALHSKKTEVARSGEEISELDTDIKACSPTNELKETSAEDISFADLQNMSDSILEASEMSQHDITAMNVEPQNSVEINESETVNNLKSDDAEPTQSKVSGFLNGISKNLLKDHQDKNVSKDINSCPSDLVKSNSGSGNNDGSIDNDLETLASEPIANSIFRLNPKSLAEHLSDIESRLRQNIIVQPASLIRPDNLNIFRTPTLSIPDISELNTNIPTLGEIRARVSEILSGLARQADDDDVSSESDSDDFASNVNPVMSTGASSSKPVSIFSPLQPLEDINLDIIQLKPIPLISGTNPLSASLPGLNLNTYQAKLAVPKSLNLKPLNLASTLGTGGGLLGARLSVGPDKKGKIGKNRGKAKKIDINSDHSFGRIGSTLADVTARMQNHARNILNIPKSVSEQTLQASNTLENFAENIRSHTENSIRNIHRNKNFPFSEVSTTSKKPSAKVFGSSRNALNTPQSNVVDNLKAQTETSIKDLHEKLTSPLLAHENALLTRGNLNDMVDNLKSQTENTFRNIQQSPSMSPLTDINDSVHKTAKNILKSSAVSTPGKERLEESAETLGSAVNNLLSQTETAIKNIQQTNIPSLSEISKSIQKSAHNALKSTKTGTDYLKSTLQPSLPLETVVDNFRLQPHAQDLLKSPNTLRNILQAPAPIDLKPHAEKTVKDLQKTLKATLRNSPVKDLHKLANPESIVQMISNHQEDVNDKLFAIHTDLNDRLESLHNEVMDPERLKSILSPPSNQAFELFAIPLPNNRMSYPLSKNAGLKMKQPSINRDFKDIRKSILKASVSKHKTGAMMRAPITEKGHDRKTLKMSKAASAPVTARTNKPVSTLNPKKPTLTKSLDRDSSKKPSLSKLDTLKSLHGIKKPLLSKHKPLVENKIKVTFASTTHKPPPAQKPVLTSTVKPKVSGIKRFKPKPPVRQPTPWNGWGESRSASEPTRKDDPLPSPSRAVPKIRTSLRHHPATPIDKPGSHVGSSSRLKPLRKLKPQPIMKLTPPSQGRASNRESKPLSRPEKPAGSLLSKLTDALKNKHTKANLRSSPDLDVAPAPSDHVEKVVALGEPMKENVSYKCKMMCVKLE